MFYNLFYYLDFSIFLASLYQYVTNVALLFFPLRMGIIKTYSY